MKYFTRMQVVEILEIDEGFLTELEQEEIIEFKAEQEAEAQCTEMMLERIRVAHNLVHQLDVNLAGAAVIVQMREDMADLRRQLEAALRKLQQAD